MSKPTTDRALSVSARIDPRTLVAISRFFRANNYVITSNSQVVYLALETLYAAIADTHPRPSSISDAIKELNNVGLSLPEVSKKAIVRKMAEESLTQEQANESLKSPIDENEVLRRLYQEKD